MRLPKTQLLKLASASILTFFLPVCATAGPVTVQFQPSSLTQGPFPNDSLSVADSSQKTGRRIDLPPSADFCDPAASPSVCSNVALLNQLDGFSVNPRLMVCFSAAINPNTLTKGINLRLFTGSLADLFAPPVLIDQIIFDPSSNCAFAKPRRILKQQSRYLLTVTEAVQDTKGNKVAAQAAFGSCLKSRDPYCEELALAVNRDTGFLHCSEKTVAAALFTTMSATTWLEQTRRFVDAYQPAVVLPAGNPSSFNLAKLQRISWIPAQSGLPSQDIPLGALAGIGEIAFGLYLSPNFLNPLNGTIATTPTNAPINGPIPVPGVPAGIPAGYVPVSFHVFLPAGSPPPGGFPFVIYGHGLGDAQFGAPTFIASTLAKSGFATLAIEITGHGYGAGSAVNLTGNDGTVQTVATPGRGILIPGNTQIGPTDGCIIPGAIAVRDCGRQTAIDLFALIATVQRTHGLGLPLNAGKVFYLGQSLGSTYGTLFEAVEPQVPAAVFSVGGGTSVDVARLAISGRPLGVEYLAPFGLLNVPPASPEPYFHDAFNDNYVFRGNPPVTNNVPEALSIQAAFEAAEWLGMLGDPLSYAPHFTSPLAGVPQKTTLFQFGLGDLEVPNPTESALVRAAEAHSSTWFFRFDRAVNAGHPELLGVSMPGVPFPILPHRILSNPTIFAVPAETSIALAEQRQVAKFFSSGGKTIADPNQFVTAPFSPGEHLFEVPVALPEQLNFLQFAP
jgi:Bacterial virulence factor lipase N-terminal